MLERMTGRDRSKECERTGLQPSSRCRHTATGHLRQTHTYRAAWLPLLLWFPVAALCAASAHAETRSLTLDQARAIAMEKNRDIEKAREYARYVQGKYIEERSAALPQIGLNGGIGTAQDRSLTASAGSAPRQTTGSLELSFSQPLYTWGKIGAAIRAAEVGLKTAHQQLRLYRQAAWRDVSIAWYDIALAKELKRLADENLAQKNRHLDEARKKFAAGVATDYDVLAAEVAAANARPEVIRTGNSIRITRERLRFLLASSSDVDADGTLTFPATEQGELSDSQRALELAQKKRPELADLRLRIGIYEELVTIAAAENKPRLDLKGGIGWHMLALNDPGSRSADGTAWNVGIALSFPFFDGMKSSGRVTQAQSDLRTRQIEENSLKDAVALEVRDAAYAVSEAQEIITALSGTARQAERLLAMAEKGFEFGVKTRLDVDDAQLNLLQANSSLARARHDYLAALVRYQWVTGTAGE